MSILLPIQRFKELAAEKQVGSLAAQACSLVGSQGFPADLSGRGEGAAVRARLLAERVDCVPAARRLRRRRDETRPLDCSGVL